MKEPWETKDTTNRKEPKTMTYGELITKATPEQRREVRERVEKIIGTKEQAKASAASLTERIQKGNAWEKQYEKLAKVFLEKGAEALSLHFTQRGRFCEGVTASGKKWRLEGNCGWTERSRYCGTLYIEGIGTVFTSGRLDKCFDYILNN